MSTLRKYLLSLLLLPILAAEIAAAPGPGGPGGGTPQHDHSDGTAGGDLGTVTATGDVTTDGSFVVSNLDEGLSWSSGNQFIIGTSGAHVSSGANVSVLLDSNANGSNSAFEVETDTATPGAGTSVLRASETKSSGIDLYGNTAPSAYAFVRFNSSGSVLDSMNAGITNPAGNGTWDITFPAGVFGSTPACSCQLDNAGFCYTRASHSSTLWQIQTATSAGSNTDLGGQVICLLDQ